jgi:hypothetical protein
MLKYIGFAELGKEIESGAKLASYVFLSGTLAINIFM